MNSLRWQPDAAHGMCSLPWVGASTVALPSSLTAWQLAHAPSILTFRPTCLLCENTWSFGSCMTNPPALLWHVVHLVPTAENALPGCPLWQFCWQVDMLGRGTAFGSLVAIFLVS